MTSLIVAAKPQDKSFWNVMHGVLGRQLTLLCTQGGKLTAPREPAEFVLAEAGSYGKISCDRAVVIFRDACPLEVEFDTGCPVVAVVDSCNRELAPLVSSTGLPAITCGLSPRDTITLSSIGTDSAVINLQRSVECLDGTLAEPQEIPVRLSNPIDSFALMAIASVFLLCGKAGELQQAVL